MSKKIENLEEFIEGKAYGEPYVQKVVEKINELVEAVNRLQDKEPNA